MYHHTPPNLNPTSTLPQYMFLFPGGWYIHIYFLFFFLQSFHQFQMTAPFLTSLTLQVQRRNTIVSEWCASFEIPAEDVREGKNGVVGRFGNEKNAICTRCRTRVFEREGAVLRCGNPDHFHCIRCLHHMAETCLRLFMHKDFYGNSNLRQLLPGMVMCSACLHPSLLEFKESEVPQTPSRPFDLTTTVSASTDASGTNVLTYHVDELYQNERRSFGGKFSKTNLFRQDYRGAWSNETGTVKLKGKASLKCPNASYHWISEWNVDDRTGLDAHGWEYSHHWPGELSMLERWVPSQWKKVPDLFTFVRRRKWRRLRLRLSDDDCHLLAMHHVPCRCFIAMLTRLEEY